MKISYMLKREDFYDINQKTLDKYYNSEKKTTLYIYPELNAIVRKIPGRKVKKYLYVEYNVKSSFFKKIMVFLYTRLTINSLGLLSKGKCYIGENVGKNCLIYPCNKKIRVFDFDNNTVRVFPKVGFINTDIKKEIEFRTQHKAEFIPSLNSYGEDDYTETIIDGYPLARARHNYNGLKDTAYEIWQNYIKETVKEYKQKDYGEILKQKAQSLLREQVISQKKIDIKKTEALIDILAVKLNNENTVKVGLSHGDLQPGNIWVENKTDRIIIIDWESYDYRSIDYDYATLNLGVRKINGISSLIKSDTENKFVIVFEDLIFKMQELVNLPFDYGSKEFDEYIDTVFQGIENV